MLGGHKIIAFVGVRDPVSTKAFYENVLGLPLVSEDDNAQVYDAGGTMLRATYVQELGNARYTTLGWQVPDIEAVVRGLTASGVRFERYLGLLQDELGIWESPTGARVAWFRDPGGNLLSVTQLPVTATLR